jgi:integrator complex subunit 11
LGAAAFLVSSGGRSLLYTGDFSGAADHHLSGHAIPRLFPDVVITESTYGNRSREPMYRRERTFVQQVHRCVLKGGRVLIPVFAVGRLQEICMMLNDYWERMDCTEPIYFASGMGAKATDVYKQCIRWMNPTLQTGFYDNGRRTYNFSKITQFRTQMTVNRPCVMVATSGMLNNGFAHDLFIRHKWYNDPQNLVVFPGYCGERTLGRAVLESHERGDHNVVWDSSDGRHIEIVVRCQVARVSFSAHADQFEILKMCQRLSPGFVITVHGDPDAVKTLAAKVHDELGIDAIAAPPINLSGQALIVLPSKEMQVVEIERECVHGSNFEGTRSVDLESRRIKISSLQRAAALSGSNVASVLLKRRVSTTTTFEEVVAIFKRLRFIDWSEELEAGQAIQTKHFTCEFTDSGLLLTYELGAKAPVNTFTCLLARFIPR